MKTPLSIIAFLVISITSLAAGDTKYFSKFVSETDAPLRLEVPANFYMDITDFRQSQVQGVIGSVVASKGAANVSVLVANSDKRAVLAGPIVVTVNPVPGATLFITYLLGRN